MESQFSGDGIMALAYLTPEGLRPLQSIENMKTQSEVSKMATNLVFKENQFVLKERMVFVLSPFGEPFDKIFADHIRPTAEKIHKLQCFRADDIFDNQPIIEDIWRSINEARIVIAELTGKNANVFYETGLAHAIGKEVILITQSMDDVPFDLRHRRCIVYEYTPPGIDKLQHELSNTITSILNRTKENSVVERITQLVSERLTEETPDSPPHGLTGEICRKSGLYRVQGGGPYLIQDTFAEGDVFPSAPTHFGEVGGRPLGMNEKKVVWVYQPPGSDEYGN